MIRLLPLAALGIAFLGSGLAAEKYSGPRPPKPDVPYLLHADNLIATEAGQAREDRHGKSESSYSVPGAASRRARRWAEPIFCSSPTRSRRVLATVPLRSEERQSRGVMARKRNHPLRVTVKPLGDGCIASR